jgi:DNA-binding IclR family transcriptional regulator
LPCRDPPVTGPPPAAPVLDGQGRAIGALNIAVSRARWDPETSEARYAQLLRAAAASISAPRLPHRAAGQA